MNWFVFWTMLIVLPVGVVFLIGCVRGVIELEERLGWRWAFPAFMALVIVAMATMFGMAK